MKTHIGREEKANPMSDYVHVTQGSAPYQDSLPSKKMDNCQTRLGHNRRSCSPNVDLEK